MTREEYLEAFNSMLGTKPEVGEVIEVADQDAPAVVKICPHTRKPYVQILVSCSVDLVNGPRRVLVTSPLFRGRCLKAYLYLKYEDALKNIKSVKVYRVNPNSVYVNRKDY